MGAALRVPGILHVPIASGIVRRASRRIVCRWWPRSTHVKLVEGETAADLAPLVDWVGRLKLRAIAVE